MSHDLFEQLADLDVPPMPEDFACEVHTRVNKLLLAVHLAEFASKALFYSCLHFAEAFLGLVIFSLSGRFQAGRRDRSNVAP